MALDYGKINVVRMLFIAAVVNGILAPPLLVLVVLVTSDKKVMGKRFVNSLTLRLPGWTTVIVMALASIALFLTWLM